jgi:hypothetical protein
MKLSYKQQYIIASIIAIILGMLYFDFMFWLFK